MATKCSTYSFHTLFPRWRLLLTNVVGLMYLSAAPVYTQDIAKQISTVGNASATLAVDGDTETCTQTTLERNPWWRRSYSKNKTFIGLTVINGKSNNLKHLHIYSKDDIGKKYPKKHCRFSKRLYHKGVPKGGTQFFRCNGKKPSGKHLIIRLNTFHEKANLSLCEVRVSTQVAHSKSHKRPTTTTSTTTTVPTIHQKAKHQLNMVTIRDMPKVVQNVHKNVKLSCLVTVPPRFRNRTMVSWSRIREDGRPITLTRNGQIEADFNPIRFGKPKYEVRFTSNPFGTGEDRYLLKINRLSLKDGKSSYECRARWPGSKFGTSKLTKINVIQKSCRIPLDKKYTVMKVTDNKTIPLSTNRTVPVGTRLRFTCPHLMAWFPKWEASFETECFTNGTAGWVTERHCRPAFCSIHVPPASHYSVLLVSERGRLRSPNLNKYMAVEDRVTFKCEPGYAWDALMVTKSNLPCHPANYTSEYNYAHLGESEVPPLPPPCKPANYCAIFSNKQPRNYDLRHIDESKAEIKQMSVLQNVVGYGAVLHYECRNGYTWNTKKKKVLTCNANFTLPPQCAK